MPKNVCNDVIIVHVHHAQIYCTELGKPGYRTIEHAKISLHEGTREINRVFMKL